MWETEKGSGWPEGRAEVWGGTGKKAFSGPTKGPELHPEDTGDVQRAQTGSHLHFVKLEALLGRRFQEGTRNVVLKQGCGSGDGGWGTVMVPNGRDGRQGYSLEGEGSLASLGLSGWGDVGADRGLFQAAGKPGARHC